MNNKTTNNQFTVVGLFKNKDSAECAFDALSERGYESDDADVIMSDKTRDQYYSGENAEETELGSKALEGAGAGSAIGGTLGAIVAGVAAIGTSVLLPGLGLVVAGPLAAALVGAGAGGLAGGLVGALIGYGIPEEHAEVYESGIKSGGVVLRVNPKNADDARYIADKWKSCGGANIYSNAETMTTANARGAAASGAGKVAIPVIEEELQVGKRAVGAGGVRVETEIDERQVNEAVNLKKENINVERHPVNRPATQEDLDKTAEGKVTIPLVEEVPVVAKEARVVEEIVVEKDVAQHTETISDKVRRTDVDVENLTPEQMKKQAKG